MAAILCVDDESSVCALLDQLLRDMGHEPILAASVREAIEVLTRLRVDLLIADCVMPDRDGIQLLDFLRDEGIHVPAIVMSGYSTSEHAQAASHHGAVDFLTKPLRAESVHLAVKSALIVDRLRRENEESRREITQLRSARAIVGESEALRDLMEALDVVAPTGAAVLLHGEPGTGKDLFAREIHARSPRYDHAFVSFSCASTPESAVESLLFGHEPDGAVGTRAHLAGALERASRGTLVLGEVSELRMHVQGKLLRALQEERIQRLGGVSPIRLDVRVIATTRRDLAAEVEAGRFMRELYAYLSVVSIRTPPLRERIEDIPRLVENFVQWNARQLGIKAPAIPPATFDYLRRRPWPGNVRELANSIERAMMIGAGSALTPESFGRAPFAAEQPNGESSRPLHGHEDAAEPSRVPDEDVLHIRTLERIAIHRALKKTGGHKAKAAELLGINERTLRNKLKAEALPVWVSTSDDAEAPPDGTER
ncbi:MAG TPA: sigma-54 dependent transcriptional regulator [Candidatus Eisenbacteria bacterium]